MVELFPERRRAEVFARALDGHAAPTDARLQALLDTAARLAAVPLVQPREQFRDSLRARLMEAAAAELTARPVTTPETPPAPGRHAVVTDNPRAARRRRRLVALATGMVLIGGGAGVAAASEQALPGEVLYPVKRSLESAGVVFARGDAAEGRALLERASTRLDEVETLSASLAADGSRSNGAGTAGLQAALTDFATDASTGGSRLLQSYSQTGDPADLRALRDFAADSHRVLSGLAGTLPPSAQPSLAAADDTLVALDGMALRACPDCTVAPPLHGLPTSPVNLPDLPADSTPATPGGTTQDKPADHRRGGETDQTGQTGQTDPAGGSPARQPSVTDGLPILPDLRLPGTGGQQPQQQDTTSDGGGGSGGQQGTLDLGDVLTPSAPQRRVDAPLPHRLTGDLGDVTKPLRDPLSPLLDGGSNTVDDTGDGVGGLLD